MGSTSSDVTKSSSTMSARLIEAARAFEKLIEETRELQRGSEDLYHSFFKMGDRPKMLSGFRKDLKILKSDLTSLLTSSLSGEGVSSAEKRMGASIVSDLDTQLNTIYTKFARGTKGVSTAAEFDTQFVRMMLSLDTVVTKYEKLSNSVIKLREQEQKVTEQRRYQATELEALKSNIPVWCLLQEF